MGSHRTRRGHRGLDMSKLEASPNRDGRAWPSGGKQTGAKLSSPSSSLEVTSAVNTSCLYLDTSQDLKLPGGYSLLTCYLAVSHKWHNSV